MLSIQRLSRMTSTFLSRIDRRAVLTQRNDSKLVSPSSAEESDTSRSNRFDEFLLNAALQYQARTPFPTLLEQLHSNANVQLPYILPHENLGRKKSDPVRTDMAESTVTIAHVLPSKKKVILASGFAVLDGRLLVTCAHTFYQASRYLSSGEFDGQSQSIAITSRGELLRVSTVESHLVSSDLVVLSLEANHRLPSFAVDPYPAPVSTSLLCYEFVGGSLSSPSLPSISFSWQPAEVLFYKGQCGQEVATGTYDELSSMMYSHSPAGGSSGGAILSRETGSVVGIVRGSELSYANRKLMGFAIPSECLLEAFRLPGMPDELK